MRVGIVGAGAAGMATGHDLANAGHSVSIFESAPFIGGQASTIEVGGGRLERGYHHLFTNDTAIIDLIGELGLTASLKWYKSSVGTYAGGKVYKTTTPLDVLRLSAVPFMDRLKLGMMAVRLQRLKDWRSLEGVTADHWLRTRLGGRAYEALWNPLRGKFGAEYDKIGMPWLWSKIQTRIASRKGIGGEKLGYPINSFDEIFEALRQRIVARGGNVQLESPVHHVTVNDNAATGLEFRTNKASAQHAPFEAVLITAPSFNAVQLADFPADYKSRLDTVRYLAAVVVVLELDRPLTNYYWMNIADRSVPFLGIIEHTNMIPRELYGGHHLLYLTNYLDRSDPMFKMSSDELVATYLHHLTKFNPAFERSWVKGVHYNSLSAAQPVIETNYSQRIPAHRTPIRRLYLANTTQIYPEDRGTNYSVRMGRDVPRMILADEKNAFRNWRTDNA